MLYEDRYDSLIQYYGERANVDWLLMKEQIRAESNFDPDATSAVGAKGVAQFMQRTWEEWQDGTPGIQELPPHELRDRRNPEHNIRAQAAYMRWLIDKVHGDLERALAAYNWGIGRVLKLGARIDWKTALPLETRKYVAKITQRYWALKGVR